jgi:hypothetical protein
MIPVQDLFQVYVSVGDLDGSSDQATVPVDPGVLVSVVMLSRGPRCRQRPVSFSTELRYERQQRIDIAP